MLPSTSSCSRLPEQPEVLRLQVVQDNEPLVKPWVTHVSPPWLDPSHSSVPSMTPSPHTGLSKQPLVSKAQASQSRVPVSKPKIWQVPSLRSVPSHCSPTSVVLLPHTGAVI